MNTAEEAIPNAHANGLDCLLFASHWLRPTVAAEIAWYELANLLEGLSQRLQERSWLRAVPILQQLSRLRVALVAVAHHSGDTLREAVTSRIAQGIVSQDGLVSHLSACVNDTGISAQEKDDALAFLAQVEEERQRSPGKDEGRAEGATSTRPSPGPITQLLASTQTAGFALTGKLEETFLKLDQALQQHVDYKCEFTRDVRILLYYQILYLAHCLNVTPKMGGIYFPSFSTTGRANHSKSPCSRAFGHTFVSKPMVFLPIKLFGKRPTLALVAPISQ